MNTDFNCEICCDNPQEIKEEKKYMSRFFKYFTLAYIIVYGAILACCALMNVLAEVLDSPGLCSYKVINAISSLNTPCIFAIIEFCVRRFGRSRHPVMDKITPYSFLAYMAVCMFLMFSGSVLGNVMSSLVNIVTGSESVNIVEEYIKETSMFEMFLYAVVLAPIFEELIFRKIVVDYFSRYGTAFCIVISGLTFGLFHGNFYQFFYAFAVGSVFAFVYCVYGKIWHTILLHAIMNFIGSIVPMILGFGDDTSIVTIGLVFYFVSYIFIVITGGVLFFVNVRKRKLYYVSGALLKPYRTLFKSVWFIVAVILSVIMFVVSFISL